MARRPPLPRVASLSYEGPSAGRRLSTLAFFAGILLAVLAALIPPLQVRAVTQVIALLGILVGLLNITAEETTEFLVAAIALLLVGAAGAVPDLGDVVLRVLSNIIAFVAPAALVVALIAIWRLAEHR
jgi:hypothetical protein